MSYLLIENKGEIDPNAFTLMGGTTKRGETAKIGQWGSGNKYAVACLLRNNVPFKVFSGEREVLFTTEEKDFRGTKLQQILVDGKETSLTTEMGFDWRVWFAIREIYSNAIDEGGEIVVPSTEKILPREGKTRVYIAHTPEVKSIIDNWSHYFSAERTDILYERDSDNRVFSNDNKDQILNLYRKGIRCVDTEEKSLFHYDCDFEINESRVVSNTYGVKKKIVKLFTEMSSVETIKRLLMGIHNKEVFEYNIEWWLWSQGMNSAWRGAIGNRRIVVDNLSGYFEEEMLHYECVVVPASLGRAIKQYFPEIIVYGFDTTDQIGTIRKVEQSQKISYLLKECSSFLKEVEYVVNYPIEVVEFIGNDGLVGRAKDGKILISKELFSMGKREVILAIMEENEKLKTKTPDSTVKSFKTHLFNLFLSEKEERYGTFC